MANRIPVEHFKFPVEKIKAGYYSDAYFIRSQEILNGDNHHPRVLMQIFPRADVVVCGIDETIALLKQCAFNPENLVIKAIHDGDEVKEWDTIMTIEGDYADFAHLETLPLRYFDGHTHGELMSRFTNDTDTLRDMLSNSIPQLVSSLVTVIAVNILAKTPITSVIAKPIKNTELLRLEKPDSER